MNRNGYFQIEKKNDGVYLHVTPPVGEGKKAAVDELQMYLDKKKVIYGEVVPGMEQNGIRKEIAAGRNLSARMQNG